MDGTPKSRVPSSRGWSWPIGSVLRGAGRSSLYSYEVSPTFGIKDKPGSARARRKSGLAAPVAVAVALATVPSLIAAVRSGLIVSVMPRPPLTRPPSQLDPQSPARHSHHKAAGPSRELSAGPRRVGTQPGRRLDRAEPDSLTLGPSCFKGGIQSVFCLGGRISILFR